MKNNEYKEIKLFHCEKHGQYFTGDCSRCFQEVNCNAECVPLIDQIAMVLAYRDNLHGGEYPKWNALSQEGRDYYRNIVRAALKEKL